MGWVCLSQEGSRLPATVAFLLFFLERFCLKLIEPLNIGGVYFAEVSTCPRQRARRRHFHDLHNIRSVLGAVRAQLCFQPTG